MAEKLIMMHLLIEVHRSQSKPIGMKIYIHIYMIFFRHFQFTVKVIILTLSLSLISFTLFLKQDKGRITKNLIRKHIYKFAYYCV